MARISLTRWVSEELTKGGLPAAHSYSTHPSAHRSEAVEWVDPSWNSSGAM